MSLASEYKAPRSIQLRPTVAGAVLGPITVAGILLSLMLAGPVALLTSAASRASLRGTLNSTVHTNTPRT